MAGVWSRNLALLLLLQLSVCGTAHATNKLMLVLLDGFRWDYTRSFRPGELPGFELLRQRAVAPQALVPVFPSLSFVNYYAIMTGLYAGINGMVDNYMWDEQTDLEFLIGDNPDQYKSFWWNDGEPLWITAAKQGKKSYMWFWNGCEVEIRGHRPTFCSPYQETPNPDFGNFSMALREAVNVLHNGTADMAAVYLERVDDTGHHFGPDATQTRDVIRQVDGHLKTLLDRLAQPGYDNINLMIFSDHGMAPAVGGQDTSPAKIQVLDHISSSDWRHASGSTAGPILHIWPVPGRADYIYNRLKGAHPHLTVYRKAEIPDKYHFKEHRRVGDIVLVADLGYAIVRNKSISTLPYRGFHGYDNAEPLMGGIFFASGPDFKRNATLRTERLPNVNLYQLMCHVMGLSAAPHNGTWSAICDALSDVTACSKTSAATAPVSHTGLSLAALITATVTVLLSNY